MDNMVGFFHQKQENESLIDSMISRGETALLHGDISGLDLFETAEKLMPENADIYFRAGRALYAFGSEDGQEKILFLAGRKFKKALALDPTNLTVWHAWGNTLAALGEIYDDVNYFLQAEEKYKQALERSKDTPRHEQAELLWDFGNSWRNIGELSGESYDLRLAVNAFEKAAAVGGNLPAEFWIDYSYALLPLGERINDPRLFVKAVHCLRRCVAMDTTLTEGWRTLGYALIQLWDINHEEETLTQADECFATAVKRAPDEGEIWLEWAIALLKAGRHQYDVRRLRSCVEKCQQAAAFSSDVPYVNAIWGEALAYIGLATDRLDIMYEGENKIAAAVENSPDIPEIWLSYGGCLNALATYFNDIDLHYQAIEKFQEGLTLDRTQADLWHAMATSHSTLAHMDLEPETFAKAYRFFSKSLHLNKTTRKLADLAIALSGFGELMNEQKYLEEALTYFEQILAAQKNAIYYHPDWLFHYALTLDLLGDYHEEENYYLRAIEILCHVLMVDPDFPEIHFRLALAYTHCGELSSDFQAFYKAAHHFRLSNKRAPENDRILLEWGISLINLAEHLYDREEAAHIYRDAENKIVQAAKLGNVHAYYHLGCLSSLQRNYEKAFAYIQKADAFGALPPVDEMLDDEWLDGMKTYTPFREFVHTLESRPQNLNQ